VTSRGVWNIRLHEDYIAVPYEVNLGTMHGIPELTIRDTRKEIVIIFFFSTETIRFLEANAFRGHTALSITIAEGTPLEQRQDGIK